MSDREGGSGGVRFIVGVLLLGLAGFSGYVGYKKLASDGATATAEPKSGADARLSGFLSAGYGHLDAGQLDAALEQFQKASGLAENDPGVREALCRTHVARAEASYLQLQAATADADRKRLLKQLEQQIDRAREAIHQATAAKPDSAHKSRLGYFERHLNTTLLLAYVQAGETKRARGVLQARLAQHPDKKLLEQLLGRTPSAPEPAASASASASASATPASSTAVAAKPPTRGHQGERHYEFDHEPDVGHLAGSNELKLPGNAPAPAPAPAPHIDTSDL